MAFGLVLMSHIYWQMFYDTHCFTPDTEAVTTTPELACLHHDGVHLLSI